MESLIIYYNQKAGTDLENNKKVIFDFIEKLKNNNKKYSIIMLDLDHFKEINDNLGHDCGDIVLKEFVRIIRLLTRKEDYIIRKGGDEFILIIESEEINLDIICNKVLSGVEKLLSKEGLIKIMKDDLINTITNKKLHATVSIGAKQIEKSNSFLDDFKIVDELMCKSKDEGRNCYNIYKNKK